MIMEGLGVLPSDLRGGERDVGDRWGPGAIVLHFQMRFFLVLTAKSASASGGLYTAILAFFHARRRHRRPPLRGGRLR